MILKSFFQKLFLGETLIERIKSPINGEIKMYDGWFGRSMRIGGVTQSGGLVGKLWKVALSTVQSSKFKVQSCLILGLGCGNAARLVIERWPECKILGVEIDPIVVEVGKKYFGLEEVSNLEIFVADAIKFVDPKYKIHNTKYNLILVDLYIGKEFPKEAGSEEFLNGLKNILADGGMVVFNRLYYNNECCKKADVFLAEVKKHFPKVKTKKVVTNLLIFASN